jgi:hypothetical protein
MAILNILIDLIGDIKRCYKAINPENLGLQLIEFWRILKFANTSLLAATSKQRFNYLKTFAEVQFGKINTVNHTIRICH